MEFKFEFECDRIWISWMSWNESKEKATSLEMYLFLMFLNHEPAFSWIILFGKFKVNFWNLFLLTCSWHQKMKPWILQFTNLKCWIKGQRTLLETLETLFLIYYFKKHFKPCFFILKTFCSALYSWIGEFMVSFFDVTTRFIDYHWMNDNEKDIWDEICGDFKF